MSRANCDYCHISAARCFKSFYFPHVGCIVLVRFSIIIFSTLLGFCTCITFICFHMYLQCSVRSTHMILFQIMPLFTSPELLFIMMLNSCSVMQTSTGLQKIEPFSWPTQILYRECPTYGDSADDFLTSRWCESTMHSAETVL